MTAAEREMMMGTRDASWYRNPSTDRAVFYHVAVTDDDGLGPYPACNLRWVLLVEESLLPLAEVAEYQRCRRPACRSRWATP